MLGSELCLSHKRAKKEIPNVDDLFISHTCCKQLILPNSILLLGFKAETKPLFYLKNAKNLFCLVK